jgi:hypothetical protein
MRTLLLFLALSVSVLSQETAPAVKAVIKGPKEVLAGTLVFLSNEDAIGDNKVWMLPDGVKDQVASCGTSIFLALPKPGEYRFGLIVADKSANIDYTFITIKAVANITSDPTPTPIPIPTPIPVPPTGFAGLRKASTVGSSFLQDNETSKRLNTELTKISSQLSSLPLPEAKQVVVRTIESVLSARSYESRKKDWLTNWRYPINSELEKLQITDTATYSAAVLAIAGSLCIDGKCPIQ